MDVAPPTRETSQWSFTRNHRYYAATLPGLPHLPKVELEVVGDRSHELQGFLHLKRHELVLTSSAGRSAPFPYDVVGRRALDAAIIVAHYKDADGTRQIYVRSSVRPPVALREASPFPEIALWELPAGLIEPGEAPVAGAARELEEELGFALAPSALAPLGPPAFPAPALIGELHYFYHVEVDPALRATPGGDGSALEEAATIAVVTLEDLLAACRRGDLPDAKTELGLRRLADIL